MLVAIGTIAAYGEVVYSILGVLGITEGAAFPAKAVPAAALAFLPVLRAFPKTRLVLGKALEKAA
jgi:hypothetical protein